jgi:hypothetical protein
MVKKAPTHEVFAEKVDGPKGDRRPTQELRQAAKDVAAMLDSPGWAFVSELLDYRKDLLMQRVIHGRLLEQAEYASLTAMVSGIEQAQQAGQTVLYVAQRREAELERQEQG